MEHKSLFTGQTYRHRIIILQFLFYDGPDKMALRCQNSLQNGFIFLQVAFLQIICFPSKVFAFLQCFLLSFKYFCFPSISVQIFFAYLQIFFIAFLQIIFFFFLLSFKYFLLSSKYFYCFPSNIFFFLLSFKYFFALLHFFYFLPNIFAFLQYSFKYF